ncbi:hypothetical protein RhiirC2_788371 [Rhizophagus irregularis]|uniref:F-box domain-containing protein n=1 Tax=Rhizophagus irregularis TaxID=588596 RepID=A0A2N1MQA2_9GLOM|nr:hypothetical protein RhiirC2_788371 [Rhizophagus irregularis]
MSCSKLFLGDLPAELTYEIIKYFQNDFSTLHSCILVNRLLCRLVIPLLWENPFSFHTGKYDFIEIYLNHEYKIINNTFNYPSFLKYLNTLELFISVAKWFDSARNSKFGIRTGVSEQNFERFITMSLFKIFIENEVNLHTLEIKAAIIYYRELNEILELILQNQNFIHNIGNLKVNCIRGDNDNTIINNHISQIIHLHQNLKKILIYGNFLSLCQLLLSKDYY